MSAIPTAAEAMEIASRFITAAFDCHGPKPRFSIPANPERDDDLRLTAFIESHTWQPIETAPRDGTPVLCYLPQGGGAYGSAILEARHNGDIYGWQSGNGMMLRPTHWMPLPEPPATDSPQ